jgi:glucans biosynthesis protein
LALRSSAAAAEGLDLGEAQPFDFSWLRDQAKQLAANPYKPPVIRYADVLERIDYDAY